MTLGSTQPTRCTSELNPRLGYKTPNQVFFGIKPPVALVS